MLIRVISNLVVWSCMVVSIQTSQAQALGSGYEFANNGKSVKSVILTNVYTKNPINQTITVDPIFKQALESQLKFLSSKKAKDKEVDGLTINISDLIKVAQALQSTTTGINLADHFVMYQINGEDKKGNVHFTGYFVPVIPVSATKNEVYQFPLYKKPTGSTLPERYEIDFNHALDGQNLELAYSANLLSNYFMQVQGSGIVQYPDGTQELLSYGGNNGKAYYSIGKYLVAQKAVPENRISLASIENYLNQNPDSTASLLSRNKSYTFFSKGEPLPIGAANVPLTPLHSIAVDPTIIPLGSILLAKVPQLNQAGELSGYEYRLVVAQDVGGAVKGSGHVDFYCGIGDQAGKKSGALHHYGELWLLLPKN